MSGNGRNEKTNMRRREKGKEERSKKGMEKRIEEREEAKKNFERAEREKGGAERKRGRKGDRCEEQDVAKGKKRWSGGVVERGDYCMVHFSGNQRRGLF